VLEIQFQLEFQQAFQLGDGSCKVFGENKEQKWVSQLLIRSQLRTLEEKVVVSYRICNKETVFMTLKSTLK